MTPDDEPEAAVSCGVSMRTPGAISSYWPCTETPGHQSLHCTVYDGQTMAVFSDADSRLSWELTPSQWYAKNRSFVEGGGPLPWSSS